MQPKKYVDKVLPSQEFFRYLYRDQPAFERALYEMMASYARDFDASRFELTTPRRSISKRCLRHRGSLSFSIPWSNS